MEISPQTGSVLSGNQHQAIILLTAGTYVLINLIIDLSYAVTDPRIRYQ